MSRPEGTILEVKGLSARYGDVEALHSVDLAVNESELIAVLGPNGAGKSTLLRSIMGLTHTSGGVYFRGRLLPQRDPAAVARSGIVLVPEGRGIFGPMTVAENLQLGAYTIGGRGPEFERRRERVLALFPRLKERLTQIAASMSGGEQQMLAVGRGLMLKPRLLMLDEPSLGLAPVMTDVTFEKIAEIHKMGTAILLVEQNVSRALSLVDRAYVLESGRVIMHGSSAELAGNKQVQAAYLGI